ncbi:MAG: hypothetical protein RL514_1938, partial [Verrucomicrobiota bacterium]
PPMKPPPPHTTVTLFFIGCSSCHGPVSGKALACTHWPARNARERGKLAGNWNPFLVRGGMKTSEPVRRPSQQTGSCHGNSGGVYAPNLSNIFAFACMRRMRYFASKMPREPELAPVSVKRSSLSEPLHALWSNTG